MKSLKHVFAKSLRSQPARKAAPTTAPVFETLEGRQLMSATTIAMVSWNSPSGPQDVVYEIGSDHSVYESTANGSLSELGGNVSQISAGLDASGHPEVYGIAPNKTVWVNDGPGWSSLGGTLKQISASVNGTVYGLAPDNSVWVNRGSGWSSLGGQATQISAGVDVAGKPEVYATGNPFTAAFVNDGNGWVNLGGQLKQISGAINGTAYGIGEDNSVWVDTGSGWKSLGGQATQISAGLDAAGKPEVYATGKPITAVFVNDGSGWVGLGGVAGQIAAPSIGVGVSGNTVAVVGTNGQTFVNGKSGFYALPESEPKQYPDDTVWQNFSGNPLFGPGGPSPTDVTQGEIGDCWLMASLSATAQEDPNLIRKDITQRANGTYDVYFHSGSSIVDEQVDGYLPENSQGQITMAKFGTGGCTWVAIMEKAYASFRNTSIAPAYSTLSGGSGQEALKALGGTQVTEQLSTISSAVGLQAIVQADLSQGKAVDMATIGTLVNPPAGLIGNHEYSVVATRLVKIKIGTQWVPQLEVRNPWGAGPSGPISSGYSWFNCGSLIPEMSELVCATV